MAVLTTAQKGELSQACEAVGIAVNYTKPQAFAAYQAIEDWFEANRSSLSAAIDVTTAPFALTGAQKRQFVKFWLRQKFGRE